MKTNLLLIHAGLLLALLLTVCGAPAASAPDLRGAAGQPAVQAGGADTYPAAGLPAPDGALTETPVNTPTETPADTPTAAPTETPSETPTPSPTPTASETPLPPDTPTVTPTPTITNTPEPVVLLATVNTTAQCRYGPARAYLYKLGLEVGDQMAVTGRNEKATWALVTPLDRSFPCWVSAELLDIQGDLLTVERAYVWLPKSPFYGPLRNVRASGGAGLATITWDPFKLRPGDDSGQNRYLVEAFVCQAGEITLVAVSTNEPYAEIEFNSGCGQTPYANVYGVEKHGYTPPVRVSWGN